MRVNWHLATGCDETTVALCPPALSMYGKPMTVDEVLNEVEKDASFYRSYRWRHDAQRW